MAVKKTARRKVTPAKGVRKPLTALQRIRRKNPGGVRETNANAARMNRQLSRLSGVKMNSREKTGRSSQG